MRGSTNGCRRCKREAQGCRVSSSPVRFGWSTAVVWLVFLVVLLALCWVPAHVVRAAEAPAALDPETQFSIVSIEPDADSRTVKVRFTLLVPFKVLRDHLKVYPSVDISWSESSYDDSGVLTLHGEFRYGERHVISLPDNLQVEGKAYVKTLNDFLMPDMPAAIQFIDGKTVIERDSRQMLHVRLQNVERVQFQGIRVPPLLLPLAVAATGEEEPASWEETLTHLQSAAEKARALAGANPAYKPFLGVPFEEKQLFFTSLKKNTPHPFSIPLTFRKTKENGALELVRVSANDLPSGKSASLPRSGKVPGEGGNESAQLRPQPDPHPGGSGSSQNAGALPEGSESLPMEAGDTEEGIASPTQLFRITDLGLTYKVSVKSLLVWSTSLRAGTPLKAVALLACTRALEVFPIGKTDDKGIYVYQPRQLDGLSLEQLGELSVVKRRVAIEDIAYLVAVQERDVSFIEVKPQGDIRPVDIQQLSGEREEQRLLKRHVFTERGIYRPGDTVFFKGTVREYRGGKITVPKGGQAGFEITDSQGEQVYSEDAAVSAFGTAAGQFALKAYFPLGTYTLTLRYGADPKDVATCTFEVQEFRPPRHFTELSFSRETRADTALVNRKQELELLKVDIGGVYYTGGPVKHGQVRWKIFHAKTEHTVKGYPDFTFGYQGQEDRELLESGDAILDEKGRAQVEFPLDREVLSGKRALEIVASVIDFDGRAASATRTFQVTPELLVGISRHPQKVNGEEGQTLKLMVADRDGKRVEAGRIEAVVLKRGSTYVRKRNEEGNLFGVFEEVWRRTFAAEVAIRKGEATFDFDFGWYGDYLLTFTYRDEKGRSFASATLYEVEGGYDSYDEEHPEKAYERLGMFATRDSYRPGETARILFGPRRPVATYLVTVERSGVLEHRVVPAKLGLKNIDIAIRPEFVPNVFVSILGISERGAFPVYSGRYDTEAPNFVFGVVNLPVRTEPRQLKIAIGEGTEKLRSEPGEAITLDLTVLDEHGNPAEAELALGVVDESILALTRYLTPTLESLSRFDTPLAVFTGDLRTQLLHQTPFDRLKMEAATGGDGGEEGAGLTGKVRKLFKPVAYFNPSVVTDASGKARVTFTLPDTMTTYRIYAVGCDRGVQFGSVQRDLVAVKKFYLEPGMPSYFTAGDRFQFAVAAFNNLDQRGRMEFSAGSTPEFKLTTAQSACDLPANDSIKVPVSGEALLPGKATVTFSGRLQGPADAGQRKESQVSGSGSQVPGSQQHTDAVQLTVPVNSRDALGGEVVYGAVKGAADVSVPLSHEVQNATWDQVAQQQLRCRLTLARTPYLRMTEAIKYLLRYPYGCVEQTSSGVMPLAALRGLVTQGAIPEVGLEEVDKFLSRGVERLLGMQTASGGFGYWPGYSQPHLWGTIYAGMALSVARANGYAIPPDRLKRALDYLRKELKRGHQDDRARGFTAYILALNGQLTEAILDDALRGLDNPSYETQLMMDLAAAKAGLAKLPVAVDQVREWLTNPPEETNFGEFYARYRTRAVTLLAANALLPGDALTAAAADRLLAGLGRSGIWTSTSDTGWALLALSDYYGFRQEGSGTVKMVVQQTKGETFTVEIAPKGFQVLDLGAITFFKNPSFRLESSSDQDILYKLELTFPRVDYAASGHAAGFRVWKTIENADGTGEIRVGDVVKIHVHLDVTEQAASYVVLEDPLPAGLVAINSALKTEESVEESSADAYDVLFRGPGGVFKFAPSFFEIRDDRVLAFRDRIWRGEYVFSYYARAVCAGDFVLPSTKVQLMYAPEINGYTPLGRMVIEGR
jgi:alpha-2-macroglobulin